MVDIGVEKQTPEKVTVSDRFRGMVTKSDRLKQIASHPILLYIYAYIMDEKQVISVIPYAGGGDLLTDARTIIDGARQYAYSAVNVALVQRNWLLGKRISEEELKEDGKANYGLEIVKNLSRKLTAEYGKGFSGTDLYWSVRFYKAYPEIFCITE